MKFVLIAATLYITLMSMTALANVQMACSSQKGEIVKYTFQVMSQPKFEVQEGGSKFLAGIVQGSVEKVVLFGWDNYGHMQDWTSVIRQNNHIQWHNFVVDSDRLDLYLYPRSEPYLTDLGFVRIEMDRNLSNVIRTGATGTYLGKATAVVQGRHESIYAFAFMDCHVVVTPKNQ